MKVCTDACILGAYAASLVTDLAISRCLDIGTGTGLLSLMLAQESNISIDAIDINENAVKQAKENFASSPWSSRLSAFTGDITTYTFPIKYDFIISNPPFYENDLASPDPSKNSAKHDSSLTLGELLGSIDKNLSATGSFIVLLPSHRVGMFTDIANQMSFHLRKKLMIKHSMGHSYFRGILLFSRDEGILIQQELSIRDEKNNYSSEFVELLKKYYLHL